MITTDHDEDLLRGQLAAMADQLKELAELAMSMLHEMNGEDDANGG